MEKELPKSWKFETIKNSLEFVIGGDWGIDPDKYSDIETENVYCIRGSEIKNWDVQKGNTSILRKIKPSSLEKRKLLEGDILLEISGGGPDQPVGRTVIIDKTSLDSFQYPIICTNFLRLLRFKKNHNSFYINYFFKSFYLSGEIVKYQGGSNNLRNLKYKEFETIKIPLPPLPEQERIVPKLDSLFTYLETAKQGLEKIPLLLKQFRQAVLTQAVTGKLTAEFEYFPALKNIIDEKNKFWKNENSKKKQGKIINDKNNLSQIVVEKFKSYLIKKYDIASFDQIASTAQNALKAGPFGSSLKKEFYVNKGYKIYGQEQVIKDDPFYGDYYIDEERFNSLKSCKVSSGDILISLVGTIGKVLIIPEDFEPGIINPRLVKLSLHNKINPKFIKLFLQSDFIINHLKDNSHGGTMDVLNLGILKELPIPVPSLEEQTEIVRRVEALFSKADAIEAQYKKLKEQIDQLPQAILAKAFRGEV
jgi:type I restriction enzyme S subunit